MLLNVDIGGMPGLRPRYLVTQMNRITPSMSILIKFFIYKSIHFSQNLLCLHMEHFDVNMQMVWIVEEDELLVSRFLEWACRSLSSFEFTIDLICNFEIVCFKLGSRRF